MRWLDLALFLILLVFAAGGYGEGLLRQTGSLVGLLLGTLVASRLYDRLAAALAPSLALALLLEPLAFLGIVLGTWLLGNLATKALQRRRQVQEMGLDRTAGAVVGLIFGMTLVYALTVGMIRMAMPLGLQVQDSRIGKICFWLGDRLFGSLLSLAGKG